MSWNNRVLVHEDSEGDYFFQIHEVYYNEDGSPRGYTARGTTPHGNSIEDIDWGLDMMKKCLNKPILWAGDRFPEEFKEPKNIIDSWLDKHGDPEVEKQVEKELEDLYRRNNE